MRKGSAGPAISTAFLRSWVSCLHSLGALVRAAREFMEHAGCSEVDRRTGVFPTDLWEGRGSNGSGVLEQKKITHLGDVLSLPLPNCSVCRDVPQPGRSMGTRNGSRLRAS